jgi:hypothetical protein
LHIGGAAADPARRFRRWEAGSGSHAEEAMNKFSCTRSLGEEIYYATLIAEDGQQARVMAVEETNRKWSRNGGRPREWNVAVLEEGVEGPARVLDCGYREA